jgi:hypothetical protein
LQDGAHEDIPAGASILMASFMNSAVKTIGQPNEDQAL